MRRGMTLVELLVIVLMTGLVLAVILPMMSGPHICHKTLACPIRLNQIHKGWVLWAQDNQGRFPLPTSVDAATAAACDQSGNSTANLHSLMIFNTYYSPEIVICPNEAAPNVAADENYRYGQEGDPDWNPAWKWDPAFSADIQTPGGESNVSYANLALVGQRWEKQWADTLDANFAVLADRGPMNGVPNPKSNSYLLHGDGKEWSGNVAFNDGHVAEWAKASAGATPFAGSGPPTWINPATGLAQADNLFAEDDVVTHSDIWLAIFGDTDESTTVALWD